MKTTRLARAAAPLLLVSFLLHSCGGPSGSTGKTGEWIKGKAASSHVSFVSGGFGASFPMIQIRNDSAAQLPLNPLKIVIWYKDAGKKEFQFKLTEPAGGALAALNPKEQITLGGLYDGEIISGTLSVQVAGANVRELAIASAGVATYAKRGDSVEQARLILGADGAPAQEIFTAK